MDFTKSLVLDEALQRLQLLRTIEVGTEDNCKACRKDEILMLIPGESNYSPHARTACRRTHTRRDQCGCMVDDIDSDLLAANTFHASGSNASRAGHGATATKEKNDIDRKSVHECRTQARQRLKRLRGHIDGAFRATPCERELREEQLLVMPRVGYKGESKIVQRQASISYF